MAPRVDNAPANCPKRHAMLIGRWHAKISEDEHKDKNIINTQRLFDQVTGEKSEGRIVLQRSLPGEMKSQRRPIRPLKASESVISTPHSR